jgi:hypothetical protein
MRLLTVTLLLILAEERRYHPYVADNRLRKYVDVLRNGYASS